MERGRKTQQARRVIDRRGGQRGVTYLEILLALIIFAIASGGILGSYLAMHQVSEQATNTMTAVNHLNDLMERISATNFANVTASFPAGVADGGAGAPYAALVGGYALDGEQITVTYPTLTADRMEVLVTLNWTYRGRALSTQFSTIRTRG